MPRRTHDSRARRADASVRLPAPDDVLLLRAAVLHDERGVGAWRALRPRFDVDRAAPGQIRLLPLVHHTLTGQGVDDPDLGRMAGVRRAHWVRSRRLVIAAAGVVDALGRAGVETMLLKGAALADAYALTALRPMSDTDILVRPGDLPAAVGVLRSLGFTGPDPCSPHGSSRHAFAFDGPDGYGVDLHWMASRHLGPAGVSRAQRSTEWWRSVAPDEWWARSRPIDLAGVVTRAPADTDLLLHVILHGSRLAGADDLRWAADAAAIIGNPAGSVDWDAFVEQAARRRVAGPVALSTAFLADQLCVAVPAHVPQVLAATGPGARERLVARCATWSRAGRTSPARTLAELAARYGALTACEPAPAALFAFPSFVARWVGEDRPSRLLRVVAARNPTAVGTARPT